MNDEARIAWAIARAALAGFVLRPADPQFESCAFVGERWGQLRYLDNIDEAERWVELVCGKLAA